MTDDVRFEVASYGPALWGLVPAVCLAVLIVCAVRARRSASPASLAWLLPPVFLLGGVTTWYALGLGGTSLALLVVFSACCVASGVAVLARDRLRVPALAALPVAMACAVLALELMWNERIGEVPPTLWAVEGLLVLGLMLTLWFACGRRGVGLAIGVLACGVVGLLQHYVVEFRGTSILPSDVFAMGTALSVSGGYTYGLSNGMLAGFSALCVGLAASAYATVPARQGDGRRRGYATDLAAAVGTAALTAALVFVPNYGDAFGVQIDYWWSKDWFGRQGFLPSFVYAWQDLAVRMPDGYSDQEANRALRDLGDAYDQAAQTKALRPLSTAQFEAARPNVIVIQNETYCDLSNFQELRNGYTGPQYWQSGLPHVAARGDFAVSVFGGGTCNTEFEFLTGNSLAFVGTAKYPFSMYDLSTVDSLPRQLAAQGYRTIGMHPNVASNWNRDRAYRELGFDEFLSIEDFAGAEKFHTHVSDWATYERALDLLKAHDEPVLVFDVTMQNHSGYDTGSIPADRLRNYAIDGLGADDTFQLNEYLACIDESDRATRLLTERLEALDEPTVVVMYGDHHPWFSAALNDLLFPGEEDLAHAERIHNTTYALWANYDVAGARPKGDAHDHTSADLLAAMTLDAIGAPLSDFQRAQLGARQQIRAINASGWRDEAGAWHPLGEESQELGNTLHDLALVEYHNFGARM